MRLLLPLGLGLLDQALLAGIFTRGFGLLGAGGDGGLVVNTVDETGNESRVTEDLLREKWGSRVSIEWWWSDMRPLSRLLIETGAVALAGHSR